MPLTPDATTSIPAHSAAGTLLLAASWVGALIASAAVILLHSSTLTALRDELQSLGGSPAADPNQSPSGGRMFGALYQSRPTLMDQVRARPVPVVAAVAVLLGLSSGWLLLRDAEQTRALALDQRAVIHQVRAAHDSLSRVVAALRDSLTAVHATEAAGRDLPSKRPAKSALAESVPGPRTPATSERPVTTRSERVSAAHPAASHPALPPPPSFEALSPSSR